MGIKGLYPFLKKNAPKVFKRTSLRPGHVLAVDGSSLTQRLMYSANRKVSERTDFQTHQVDERHVANLFKSSLRAWVQDMLKAGVALVFVMDGPDRPAAKAACIAKRHAIREENNVRFKEALRDVLAGITPPGPELTSLAARQDYLGKAQLNSLTEEVLGKEGLEVVYATQEGEKCCCLLAKLGKATHVYSADSDVCVFQPPSLVRDVRDGVFEEIACPQILAELRLDAAAFVDFCIMCGCDFNENIPGIGPVKAFDLIKKYKRIEDIPDEAFREKSKKYSGRACLNVSTCRELLTLDTPMDQNSIAANIHSV